MVLGNFVKLIPGVPTRLHFTDHQIVKKTITDPDSHRVKEANALEFVVDRENGAVVSKSYSILSEKHAEDFRRYLDDKSYRQFDFAITVYGKSYLAVYSVEPKPPSP